MQKKPSQNSRIIKFLQSGRTLSEAQAKTSLKVKCLTKRISELRKMGVPIKTTKNSNGKTAYRLY